MKILVIEDDEPLCQLWVEAFSRAGYDAEGVGDVSSARQRLLTDAYDIVILDLNLRGESGLAVSTLATYSNPECKVIVATGTTLFPRGELFSLAPTVHAVLRKPVGINDLLAVTEHTGGITPRPNSLAARA